MDVLKICLDTARCSEIVECQTGDGGTCVELEPHGRGEGVCLYFAIPDTGSPVYFVASESPGSRWAGVVTEEAAVGRLVTWVEGNSRGKLPTAGLILGQGEQE